MPTLTIKSIPEALYRRLKASAEEHRRSLNSEVLVCLERSLSVRRLDTEAFLQSARGLRRRLKSAHLKENELNTAKRAGRP